MMRKDMREMSNFLVNIKYHRRPYVIYPDVYSETDREYGRLTRTLKCRSATIITPDLKILKIEASRYYTDGRCADSELIKNMNTRQIMELGEMISKVLFKLD